MKLWTSLCLAGVLGASALTPAHAQAWAVFPTAGPDVDEDGLNDDWEEKLIRFFRPHYLYNAGESYWPSSVTWHVQQSSLKYGNSHYNDTFTNGAMYTREQLSANPLLILQANYHLINEDYDFPSDTRVNNRHSIHSNGGYSDSYFLNFDNERNGGESDPHNSPNAEAIRPKTGVYANVVPIYHPVVYGSGTLQFEESTTTPSAICVQYWQFFSKNESSTQAGAVGDHEGDFLKVEIYVSPDSNPDQPGATPFGSGWVKYTAHHHHGEGDCPPTLRGGGFGAVTFSSEDYQPACFLERGSHEWHPTIGDNSCAITDPPHNGNGYQYTVDADAVINVGSRYAMMTRLNDNTLSNTVFGKSANFISTERQLFLFYNGKWGAGNNLAGGTEGPKAPAFQFFMQHERSWPVVYVKANAPSTTWGAEAGTNGTNYQDKHNAEGSRWYPYRDVRDVIDGTDIRGTDATRSVRTGGRVRFETGSHRTYGGTMLRFDRAMTLEKSPYSTPGIATIRP